MKTREEVEKRIRALNNLKIKYKEKYDNKEISFSDYLDFIQICRVAIKEMKWVLEEE